MMQLIVGSLLEIVHGTIRIMVIYVIGKLSFRHDLKMSFVKV